MSNKRPRRSSHAKPSRINSSRKQKRLDYCQLEVRQLLATDLGINATISTRGTHSDVVDPNMVGDIGPTHYIESIVDRLAFINRTTGARDLNKSPQQFWIDIGAAATTPIVNTQVTFDRLANRWFLVGEGTEASGNWIYIAISDTENPLQGWKSLRFVGDSTGIRHNGQLSAAVDADALLITSRNTSTTVGFPLSVSIFTIPKVDLYAANPTLTNMSRFENRSPTTYGDFLRPSVSLEASDGKAIILGSRGANKLTTVVNNVGAAGATLGTPRLIDFNPSNLIVDNNDFTLGSQGPLAEQPELDPGNIDIFVDTNANILPIKNGSDVMSNPYDYAGGLWFVQEGQVAYVGGTTRGIWYYEVDKVTNQLLQGGVVPTPAGNPWDWFMYNPGFSINNFGLLQVNYTISSQEFEVTPTAASSIAQSVYGVAIYDPIFDTIFYSNEEPLKEGKNTQFESPVFVQDGLSIYKNTTGVNSTWSWRGSAGWDPTNYNQFWGSTQWSNTVSRWSSQVTHMMPNDMTVQITANEENNIIVVRRKAGSPELVEVEIDGRVTDILPYEPLGKLVINGYDGDDIFRLDYSNGDPQPSGGFEFNGMRGADRIETNDINGGHYVVDGNYVNIYGVAGDGSGMYNGLTGFTGIEELHGGEGNDTFEVTDVWQLTPVYVQISHGFLAGSMVGFGGDDTFSFSETGEIGDSIDGGSGYNTLSFQNRWEDGPLVKTDFPVAVQLIGPSENDGFDGFTPDEPGFDGPIGDNPDQFQDTFRDIDFIRGSDVSFDDVRGVDNVAFVFVDDENSYYEAAGERLGFFQINSISTSQFADHFVGIRNNVNPLNLLGLGGDDLYDFSSDAPTNNGNTQSLNNLLFAQGGTGANVMNVSNKSGTAVTALILNNRIGGLGEIAYNAVGGTFALNVWASAFADHIDLHSFFFTNTLNLHLGAGDDTMSIQDLSKATINIFGEAGNDVYTVEKIQGIDLRNLSIIDSVGAERDRVQLAGTILNETFTITQSTFADLNVGFTGIEWFGVETRGGHDTINLQTVDYEFYINGESGDDIINISSDAPTNTGTLSGFVKPITVEGGSGRNELRISNMAGGSKNVVINNSTITGLFSTVFTFLSTGGTFDLASGIGGIYILGSSVGNDIFTVNTLNVDDSIRINGLGGNDLFVLNATAEGDTQFEGDLDTDRYTINYRGLGSRAVVIKDETLVPATGRLTLNGTSLDDSISVTGGNADRGNERVTIQGNLALFVIDGMGGDDNVVVNWTTGVTTMDMLGNTGADTLSLLSSQATTFANILGGTGDDTLIVGTNANSDVNADGEAGADRYNVKYQTGGSRSVDVRDSGTATTEQDVAFAVALNTDDDLEIRTGRVILGGQIITFDAKTERLIVQGLGGDDNIRLYGSLAGTTQVQAGTGNDQITVHSTTGSAQTTLDGNDGNDNFLVLRTTENTSTILRGGNGDDRFNIGSALEENNGNLGTIRGIVTAQGNASNIEDRLYLNDFNVNVPYNYVVTPTAIRSLAGPNNILRPQFAGVRFDGTMEFARLDATIAANFFSVRPSKDTRFYIDGNLPSPIVGSGDFLFLIATPGDGHELHITDAPRGRGYWDFTDGTQEVRFEEIETTNEGSVALGLPSAPKFFFSPSLTSGSSTGGQGFQAAQMSNPNGVILDQLAGSIVLEIDDELSVALGGTSSEDSDSAFVELSSLFEIEV